MNIRFYYTIGSTIFGTTLLWLYDMLSDWMPMLVLCVFMIFIQIGWIIEDRNRL